MITMQIKSQKTKVQSRTFVVACLIAASFLPFTTLAHYASAPLELSSRPRSEVSPQDKRSQEALQHLVMSLLRSLGSDNPDINGVRQIKEIRASAEDLLGRISDRRPADISDQDRPFYNGIRSLRIQYAALNDKIGFSYPMDEPKSILNTVSTLDALTQRAASEEMTTTFKIGIPRKVKALESRIFAYRSLVAGKAAFRTDIVSRAMHQIAMTQAAETTLSSAIIGSNEVPQDAYLGSDLTVLDHLGTNAFLEKFPGVRVIDVVLPDKSWTSQNVWAWEAGSWNLVSSAEMKAFAIVQGEAEEEAWVIPFSFSRSNAVVGEVFCQLPEKLSRPGPSQIVALSKIVKLAGSPN